MVSNYGLGVGDTHFTADNVDLSQGMLGLRLTQLASGVGVISNGAEVQSVEKYGFGTYMWRARMSSTADSPFGPGEPRSGATSGVFVYTTGSQTEIDFENEDAYPEWVHLVTWLNGHQVSQSANVGASIYRDFHEYSVVWISQSVVYSVDGRPVATETSHVPQVPAYVMMNHWGTNSADWGGTFTAGTRWMWVHSFSFVPK
jgi:beta-glucanase (GH16 family)